MPNGFDWAEYEAYLDGDLWQEEIDAANRDLQEAALEDVAVFENETAIELPIELPW